MADPYIGEIRIMGFNFAPLGWSTCNGQVLKIQQNSALFSVIGNVFGGDGTTTFAFPNLSGRIPMHTGQGSGLTNRVIGEQDGVTDVTLTASQMAVHTHSLIAQNVNANVSTPGTADYFAKSGYTLSGRFNSIPMYSSVMTSTLLSSSAITPTGGGQSHINVQPYLSLNFCIAVEGIYPVRS